MGRQIGWKPRLIHPSSATSLSLSQVSALAELFFWRILPQSDDQGRLPAEPTLLKAIACPMRAEITTQNIPCLLEELEKVGILIRYTSCTALLLQVVNWWAYQTPQWAYPSRYPPPEGWLDHLRYRKAGEIITENWPPERLPKALGKGLGKGLGKALGKGLGNPSNVQEEEEEEKTKVKGGEEAAVEGAGSNYSHNNNQIIKTNQYLEALVRNYRAEIGPVSVGISSQLADFAEQLKKADTPLEWINDAFAEAAAHNVRTWAYLKAILNTWLHQGRKPTSPPGTENEDELAAAWQENQERALRENSAG